MNEVAEEVIELKVNDYEMCFNLQAYVLKRSRGFVYIVSDGNAVKIGRTDRLESRLRDLSNMNSRPLVLLQAIETDFSVECESLLHSYFSEYRLHGEWFDLLPVFGIKQTDHVQMLQMEISKLKKENKKLRLENNRWRKAKYGNDDNYCSHCGHVLSKWFEEVAE